MYSDAEASFVTYPRLEPVNKLDNMGMPKPLKHVEFVIDHFFIATNILLQDDLDGDFAVGTVGFANDAIGSGAKSPPELVF